MVPLRPALIVINSILSVMAVTGCLVYRGPALPRYHPAALPHATPPLTVQYEARVVTPVQLLFNGPPMAERTVLLEESRRLFSQADIELTDGTPADLRLNATLSAYSITYQTFALGYYVVVSTWTCFMLPIHDQSRWLLDVKVEQNGRPLKQYQYQQTIHTWMQFFLLFGMPFSDGLKTVQRKTIDDLLFNFITDFQRDYARIQAKQDQPAAAR